MSQPSTAAGKLAGDVPGACEETCTDPAPGSSAPPPATAAAEDSDACEAACATRLPFREEQVAAQPGARPGDFARCPVSQVVFVVDGASPRHEHAGDHLYFCCQPCAKRFGANPARYLSRL